MYAVFGAEEEPVVIDTGHGENSKPTSIEYKSETGTKLYLGSDSTRLYRIADPRRGNV